MVKDIIIWALAWYLALAAIGFLIGLWATRTSASPPRLSLGKLVIGAFVWPLVLWCIVFPERRGAK